MTDTPDDLLPCPFCGGVADFERKGDRRQSTIVACTNCGCRLENGEEWNHGAGWNDRIDAQAAEIARLTMAGNSLSICAQTTGGTAGADHGLMVAIDGWSAALRGE